MKKTETTKTGAYADPNKYVNHKELTEEDAYQIQKLLTGMQVTLDALDKLAFTNFHARRIKQLSKELSSCIEKQYSEIFKDSVQGISDYYIELSDYLDQEIKVAMNLYTLSEYKKTEFIKKYNKLLIDFGMLKQPK